MDLTDKLALYNKAALLCDIQNQYENDDFIWQNIDVNVEYSAEEGFEPSNPETAPQIPILLENEQSAFGLFVRTVTSERNFHDRFDKLKDQMREAYDFLDGRYDSADVGGVIYLEGQRGEYTAVGIKK